MFDESFKKLLLIENDCLKDRLIIDGFDAWPIVRHRLWAKMTVAPLNASRDPFRFTTNVQELLVSLFQVIINQFPKLATNEKTKNMSVPTVFTFGRFKHFTLDSEAGKCRDRVLGPIADQLSKQFHLEQFIMDNSQKESTLEPFKIFPRDFPTSNFFIRGLFSSGLLQACKKQNIKPFRLIASLFIDGLLFASARKGMKRYCEFLPHPSFALIDTWYSPDMMGIVSILKESGVTVIEVQHGFIHPKHAMYVDWPPDSIDGISLRPDAFWSWSIPAMEILFTNNTLCHTGKKVFIGGYPWTYQQVQNLSSGNFPSGEELPPIKTTENQTQTLITLGAPQTDGCEDLPKSLLQVIEQRRDITFILLPHPNVPDFQNYIDSKFNFGLPNNVIVAPINSNVYSLLSICTHHITAMSTVALESPAFGIPSLIIGGIGMDLFESLIDDIWLFATDSDVQVIDDFLMKPLHGEQTYLAYIESSPQRLLAGIERCKALASI